MCKDIFAVVAFIVTWQGVTSYPIVQVCMGPMVWLQCTMWYRILLQVSCYNSLEMESSKVVPAVVSEQAYLTFMA